MKEVSYYSESSQQGCKEALQNPKFIVMNKKPRVLIAEKEEFFAQNNRCLFEQLGCEVDLVANGITALALCQCVQSYDLILLGVGLEDIADADVAKYLRRTDISTPIISLLKKENRNKRRRIAAGVSDFYIQPLLLQDVDDMFAKYLSKFQK